MQPSNSVQQHNVKKKKMFVVKVKMYTRNRQHEGIGEKLKSLVTWSIVPNTVPTVHKKRSQSWYEQKRKFGTRKILAVLRLRSKEFLFAKLHQ